MEVNDFIKKIESMGLSSATKFKLKKFWDGVPHYYNISGANITDGDLIFHASPYGTLQMDKLVKDIKEMGVKNGMVRVGSFKVHRIAPTHDGGMLIIKQKKTKKNSNLFSFLTW